MKDLISEKRVSLLHPKVINDFKKLIEDAECTLNTTIRVTQGLRTFEEQAAIYAQGRTRLVDARGNKLGIISNAKPGQSFHQYGLAVDLVEIKNGKINWNFDYSKLKPIAKKYGISWGGDWIRFKDKPHFDKSFGFTWQQLLSKYNKNDFIKGTKYVNI